MVANNRRIQCEGISASVRGATHRRKNIVNQDAVALWQAEDHTTTIMAIADGHGAKTCFRSHVGAQIAVEQALLCYKAEVNSLEDQGLKSLNSKDELGQTDFIKRSSERILKAWVVGVLAHLKEHPFSNHEVDSLDEKGRRALGGNALLAYGATLAVVMITPQLILGFNLGDGDCVIFQNGRALTFTFKDEQTLGDHTYSLCTSGSTSKICRILLPNNKVDAVMLATDGYRNSYRNEEGFNQVGFDFIHLYRQHGLETISQNLEEWLEQTSEGGSGDDISCALTFVNEEVVIEKKHILSRWLKDSQKKKNKAKSKKEPRNH